MSERPRPANPAASESLDADTVRMGLDNERRLLLEAILLVAGGGSARVTVAGLRYPEQIVEASRPIAAAQGVRLVVLWTEDEAGADVEVERPRTDER